MAGYQSARDHMGVAEWMEGRRRDLERLGGEAEAVGRGAWAAATRTGQNLAAMRPEDVRALGAQVLDRPARLQLVAAPGRILAPNGEDLTELRRQQAEFREVRRDFDRENSWMAVPALAPVATVLALEGLGAAGLRLAGKQVKPPPHVFTQRGPGMIRGDNASTRYGKLKHRELDQRVQQKPGWEYEPRINGVSGRTVKPDVGAPVRNSAHTDKRFQLELKPDTPSGRRAATKAIERYERETRNKTRAIFYKPHGGR